MEQGIEAYAAILEHAGAQDSLATLSTMVGALLLSRMVEDDALSRRIIDAAKTSLLG